MTPHFFYISDITNSLSFDGKILRKKSMLEKFRANVLKKQATARFVFHVGKTAGVTEVLNSAFILGDH